MKKTLQFVATFFLGALLFYYILTEAGLETVYNAGLLFFGWEGIVLLLLTFLIILTGTFRWKGILRAEGENVPFFRVMLYLVKGFTIDFLTPFSFFGGEALRIYLMRKEVGIKKSASSAIIDKIIDSTTHFFFLAVGLLLFLFYSLYAVSFDNPITIYSGFIFLAFFALLLFFYLQALRGKGILRQFFRLFGKSFPDTGNGKTILEVEERVIGFFSFKRKELAKGILLSFLRHFFYLSRTFIIIFFIADRIEYGGSVIAYSLTILSMLLPLPAALGGLEAISAFGFSAIGLGFGVGTMYALVVRMPDLFVCIIGTLFIFKLSIVSFFDLLKSNFSRT